MVVVFLKLIRSPFKYFVTLSLSSSISTTQYKPKTKRFFHLLRELFPGSKFFIVLSQILKSENNSIESGRKSWIYFQ